jgi:hypothetical protein
VIVDLGKHVSSGEGKSSHASKAFSCQFLSRFRSENSDLEGIIQRIRRNNGRQQHLGSACACRSMVRHATAWWSYLTCVPSNADSANVQSAVSLLPSCPAAVLNDSIASVPMPCDAVWPPIQILDSERTGISTVPF